MTISVPDIEGSLKYIDRGQVVAPTHPLTTKGFYNNIVQGMLLT